MNTIEAAKGQWAKIFAHYGLPPITGRKHFKGKCPLCERKGKFRIDDKNGLGTWICTCDSGTGFQLLEKTQGKSFKVLADEVDMLLGNHRENIAPKPQTKDISIAGFRERIIKCYSNLKSLKDTSAAKYLHNRGIYELPSEQVKFCDKQPVKHNPNSFQAIWSLATDSKGQLCYLHRTYLEGDKKARLSLVKRMDALQEDNYLEYASSVAIRMFPVASTLGIAEGIETALSCKQIYGVNTWSTMNAGHMAKFVAPKGVKHLIVFADNDWSATGEAAAYECARKNLVANNDIEKVSVRWPDLNDFNDLLTQGCEARERVFIRKQREAA
ncbi:toprim domain-containing protein [Providencia rettgeri]|uniref:DUF7146 domain-containing protein n=1 Tax=Providencia TaxID=586 RepID=UPI0010123DF2|nr:toprim domain-containing protein [Providencia rettgeri]RXN73734.1 DNA primase [Providencia rettgeri]